MFDRQRSSKTQVQRNLASKAREELEADAAGKEADLAELRSTMSKEKAEIAKLMSQRGPTLWTSSSEIRASPGTRQALPVKSMAAKAKSGVLIDVMPLKQAAQSTIRRAGNTVTKGAQAGQPGKPGPAMDPQAEAIKGGASYRPSPTRRLSNAPSGKSTGSLRSNQLAVKPAPQKTPALQASTASSSNPQCSSSAVPQNPAAPMNGGWAAGITPSGGSGRPSSDNSTNTASSGGGAGHRAGSMASTSCGVTDSDGGMPSTSDSSRGGVSTQTATDSGGRESNSRPISVHCADSSLPSHKSVSPSKAFCGPSLLEGEFNEDTSHASFADALSSWRGKGPGPATGTAQGTSRAGPHAAPGTSSQAGAGMMAKALAAASSPPKQTYFERLFWSQASQEAAASVTGKLRCLADDKEAALPCQSAK